jgi:hypothetical protein
MAWAIFTRRFLFDRRPKYAVAFDIKPKPDPQSWPRDVVEAAITAGAAVRSGPIKPKDKNTAA